MIFATGEKKTWVNFYRQNKKVKKFLYKKKSGLVSTGLYLVLLLMDVTVTDHLLWLYLCKAGLGASPGANDRASRAMICNLLQNPTTRPIVSEWQPALLRQGCMWLLLQENHVVTSPSSSKHDPLASGVCEERWMLPDDTWIWQMSNGFGVLKILEPVQLSYMKCLSFLAFVSLLSVFHCRGWLNISLTQEHLNSMGIGQWARFSGKRGWPIFGHSPPDTVRKRLAGNVPRLRLEFRE